MKTHTTSRGLGQHLMGWVILLATAYVAMRLLQWLFPTELRQAWHWLQAKL